MSAHVPPPPIVPGSAAEDELWSSARASAFEPEFGALLPETHDLICAAKLTLHPAVTFVTLHGSRSLDGSPRPDSDVDLCLHTDLTAADHTLASLEATLYEVIQTTLTHWRGAVPVDLSAAFDVQPGGQAWFTTTQRDAAAAPRRLLEGFGLYKLQKGFEGFVPSRILTLDQMLPSLVIWRRAEEPHDDDYLNALACCDHAD